MKKELLFSITKKDFDVQTFRSGGPGGQHQNVTDSGARIVHRASGAVGESRTERSQFVNKKQAFIRLVNSKKFQTWLKVECGKAFGTYVSEEEKVKRIEGIVDRLMEMHNLKIEERLETGDWSCIDNSA